MPKNCRWYQKTDVHVTVLIEIWRTKCTNRTNVLLQNNWYSKCRYFSVQLLVSAMFFRKDWIETSILFFQVCFTQQLFLKFQASFKRESTRFKFTKIFWDDFHYYALLRHLVDARLVAVDASYGGNNKTRTHDKLKLLTLCISTKCTYEE